MKNNDFPRVTETEAKVRGFGERRIDAVLQKVLGKMELMGGDLPLEYWDGSQEHLQQIRSVETDDRGNRLQ